MLPLISAYFDAAAAFAYALRLLLLSHQRYMLTPPLRLRYAATP